jgi:acetyltransferase
LLALDARVLLYGPSVEEKDLPQLAIRPYPAQYVKDLSAKNGDLFTIRPVRAEDEPQMVKFHEGLSDRTVYLRYLYPMELDARAAHERLARLCHGDYDREITLVVARDSDDADERAIMGAGRISRIHGANDARLSLLISDCCQGLGLGTELLNQLVSVARQEHITNINAIMTADNEVMKKLFTRMGFTILPEEEGRLKAELALD